MKKLLLLFMSMFFVLGTSMAQDKGEQDKGEEGFTLTYINPDSTRPVFSVNYIQLVFNKDIVVTLPQGGIDVKNVKTGEVIKITRLSDNEWLDKNTAMFLFEQKSEIGKDGKEELHDMYISTPGTYSYTIPAGCIKSVDNEEFAEQTFNFTVASALEMESYSPGYEGTDNLDKIKITFTEEIASVQMPASGLVIVDDYWTPVANIKQDVTISDDKKSVTLELDTPITTPGGYNLDIYEGIFTSVNGAINQYASLYFQVVDNSPSYTTNLKDGERVKEINNLEITFNNVKEVKLVDGADDVMVYTPAETEAAGKATLADGKITVAFDQEFTEEGYYTFAIPAGMFTMDGTPNEAREINVELFTFTIVPLEIVSITPTEDYVNELGKIVVKFNQLVSLSYDEYSQLISYEIVLKGDDKNYILTYNSSSNVSDQIEYLVNAEWNGFEYESTPITENGSYTLNLADIVVDHAGEKIMDEWGGYYEWHEKGKFCEGTRTWIISDDSSVESIETENAEQNVYDLTGRNVKHITNAGIYIVNGKKVVVK